MDGSVGLIFHPEGTQVLLVKRRDIPIWELPGGRVNRGETYENAAIREVLEETGYNVRLIRKVAVYSNSHKIVHTFECEILSGSPIITDETRDIKFFHLDKLPKKLSPYVRDFLDDALLKNNDVLIRKMKSFSKWEIFKMGIRHPHTYFRYLLTRVGVHWNW